MISISFFYVYMLKNYTNVLSVIQLNIILKKHAFSRFSLNIKMQQD